MTERREGGSVPKFIVVAVVLIALLVSGAYFVQQQSRNKPATAPVPVTELPGGEQKPAEESTTPPPANTVPNNSTTQSSPQAPVANRLPQSGPADGLLTILTLGLLAGVGVSYIQSRRRLAPL